MRRSGRTSNTTVFTAFVVGSVGQGIPFAVVAVHLDERGLGTRWIAVVWITRLLPSIACCSRAGGVASRHAAGRVLAMSGAVRALLAVALGLAIAGDAPAPVLLVLLFALVAAGTPTYPALMRVVSSVPRARRHRAATLAAGIESAVFWLGPAIGGVLVASGTPAAMPASIGLLVLSAALAMSLRARDDALAPEVRSAVAMRLAARALRAPGCRPAVVAVLTVNLLIGLLGVMLIRLAERLGGSVDRVFGALSLGQGVGAVVVFVVLVGPWRLHRRPRLPLAGAVVAVAVLAGSHQVVVAVVACLVFGGASLASEVAVSATISDEVPPELVGPAIGLVDAAMVTAMLAGAMAAPPLVAAVDVGGALLAGAVIATLVR